MSVDRLLDLLAERATQALSREESAELTRLLSEHPEVDANAFDTTAAAIDNAISGAPPPPPAALQARLASVAEQWIGQDNAVMARIAPRRGPSRAALWSGWLVAAASLALAAVGWWTRLPPPDASAQRDALLAKPGVSKFAWAPFNLPNAAAPVISGVGGDAVWDEASQRGFLRFTGLPVNDPAKQQYQIWLVDSRGLNFRINGGVFDSTSGGQIIIPVTPDLRTRDVKAVAITVEPPGGVVVSDMERRVVITTGG